MSRWEKAVVGADMTERFRALVIDDDHVTRKLTVHALSENGFLCTEAYDGDAARQRIDDSYELVVTDLIMPHVNGHALAIELLERNSRPMVVALTSVRDPRLVSDLMLRGLDDIFFKPVDYATFAAKLRAAVLRRQRDQELLAGDASADTQP
jgi:DNA-binding response OmpR family regulator